MQGHQKEDVDGKSQKAHNQALGVLQIFRDIAEKEPTRQESRKGQWVRWQTRELAP